MTKQLLEELTNKRTQLINERNRLNKLIDLPSYSLKIFNDGKKLSVHDWNYYLVGEDVMFYEQYKNNDYINEEWNKKINDIDIKIMDINRQINLLRYKLHQ